MSEFKEARMELVSLRKKVRRLGLINHDPKCVFVPFFDGDQIYFFLTRRLSACQVLNREIGKKVDVALAPILRLFGRGFVECWLLCGNFSMRTSSTTSAFNDLETSSLEEWISTPRAFSFFSLR